MTVQGPITLDRAAIESRAKEIAEQVAVETNSVAVFIGLKPKAARLFAEFATKLAEREAEKAAMLAAAPHGLVKRLEEIDAALVRAPLNKSFGLEGEREKIVKQILTGGY